MKVEVRAVRDLAEDERCGVERVDREAFAGEPDDGYEWIATHDWQVLVTVDGQVASTLAMVERTIAVGGSHLRVCGIGGVATLPEWRGRGLAAAALTKAAQFARAELGVEFCLLFCERGMMPYYGRLGWQEITDPLAFDQPSGKVTYRGSAMVLPCGSAEWPRGAIDLAGLPW